MFPWKLVRKKQDRPARMGCCVSGEFWVNAKKDSMNAIINPAGNYLIKVKETLEQGVKYVQN